MSNDAAALPEPEQVTLSREEYAVLRLERIALRGASMRVWTRDMDGTNAARGFQEVCNSLRGLILNRRPEDVVSGASALARRVYIAPGPDVETERASNKGRKAAAQAMLAVLGIEVPEPSADGADATTDEASSEPQRVSKSTPDLSEDAAGHD